jgi:excinuclease UvrABC nuclease subunit
MATLNDLKREVNKLNHNFPRPGIPHLSVSTLFDLRTQYSQKWPNAEFPGVYILFDKNKEVLLIGKASCSRTLGDRLGEKLRWKDKKIGKGGHLNNPDIRYLATIRVPIDNAFEAPAIEEYLLKKLRPSLNKQCKG